MKALNYACLCWLGLSGLVHAQTISNYQATVSLQKPSACFKFDNALTDSVSGAALVQEGGSFTSDLAGNAKSAWMFNDSGDQLSLTNDVVAGGSGKATGSLSMLFRALDSTDNSGQRFLFSQGNSTTNANAFALFFENNTEGKTDPGALKLRVGNKTVAILQTTDIVPTNWYYFGVAYDETRKSGQVKWFVGRVGDKLASGDVTLKKDAAVGDNTAFLIGNNTTGKGTYRNPGRGRVDELAFWDRELSEAEIRAQFSSLAAE